MNGVWIKKEMSYNNDMTTMNKFFKYSLIFLLSSIFSCSKQEDAALGAKNGGGLVFTAIISHPDSSEATRTILDGSVTNGVYWETGDAISINNVKYVTQDGGKEECKFYKDDSQDDPVIPYIAGYPYGKFEHRDSTIVLSSELTDNGSVMKNFPMIAYSNTPLLTFHQVCAALHLIIKGTGVLRKVVVSDCVMGLSGQGKVANVSSSTPGLEMVGQHPENAVVISCGKSLSESEGLDIYIPASWDNFRQLTFFLDIENNPTFVHLKNYGTSLLVYKNMYRLPVTVKPAELKLGNKSFSVSATKKVRFSKGNLVCDTKTGQWGFFNEQMSVNGPSRYAEASGVTTNIITHHTWGYNSVNSYKPTGTDNDNVSVEPGESFTASQDWGSQISVASGNRWRTMTTYEWKYLLKDRESADYLWSRAVVKDNFGETIYGLLIMPDDFNSADDPFYGVTGEFTPRVPNPGSYTEYKSVGMLKRVVDECGAVFLPESNHREGNANVGDKDNTNFVYWSSTASASTNNAEAWWGNYGEEYHRLAMLNGTGASVRLVKDVE